MSRINKQYVWTPLHCLLIDIISLQVLFGLQFNHEAQGYCLLVQDTASQEAQYIYVAIYMFSKMERFYENKECFKKLENIKVNTYFKIKDTPFPALPIIT